MPIAFGYHGLAMSGASRPSRSSGAAEDEAGALAEHQPLLRQLLSRITKLDKWTWFQEDPTEYPGYTDVVKKPMCMDFMRKVCIAVVKVLSAQPAILCVSQKVDTNSYNSFKEFEADMRLIFVNARSFNEAGEYHLVPARFEFRAFCVL